jgi:chaperone modulatory protein CbpM
VIGLEELLRRVAGLDRGEIDRWIDNRWILPSRHASGWLFSEVDVARVELIVEIRREFAIEEDGVSVVLGLIDQVYELRRQLRRLCDAVSHQPEEVRRAIGRAMPRERE